MKMKNLLRKLHIGGAVNEHQRLGQTHLPTNSSSSPSSSSSSSAAVAVAVASSLNSSTLGRNTVADASERTSGVVPVAVDSSADFNFLEEEFQVQLALAISASDPDGREDPESVQIKAAKLISLGCSPSVAADETLAEFLSLRYWNHNVLNYDEKVMDGFYDVYGITSNSNMQGKMPLLVDLQATSISGDVDYEVILVNRTVDPALQQLERRAVSIALECHAAQFGPILTGLLQKIVDLVVNCMGGPVGDANEMLRRWTVRSYELRNSLNTNILPLGCLDIGLSRHRALLFKVLADQINLPCRLVKGSYYTGTDEGAVNLIKIDYESEYIIDLMGAPGTLIPAEIPSSHVQNSALDVMTSGNIIKDSFLVLDQVNCQSENNAGTFGILPDDLNRFSQIGASGADEASDIGIQAICNDVNHAEYNQTERFEYQFAKLLPSLHRSTESSSGADGKASSAQKMKVKDVSKYVISAAQDPDFAQKLHAVLLESSASPTPGEGFVFVDNGVNEMTQDDSTGVGMFPVLNSPIIITRTPYGKKIKESSVPCAVDSCWKQLENVLTGGDAISQGNVGTIANNVEAKENISLHEHPQIAKGPMVKFMGAENNNLHVTSSDQIEKINTMLAEVRDWEIPWEDLQIGERIGLGSCGEVYRADWNGTEVAVKKFLDQDFSGDALQQFKYEVRIMLRLRHPNVVLFMGAVTWPPNLSILTEFLPRGSLYRLLHRSHAQLDEKRRLRMALDVAKGMNYLHTSHPPIVHRDLKSPNLLVDKNWVVKVCDFGLSRLKHHTFLSSKSTAGTPEWMAPEVLRNEPSNEKCDVYSFGVILWELATLRMPWQGMNPMQVVGAVGFQNRRLDIPGEVDPMVGQIIRDCWQSDSNLRPSFSQLMSRLQHLVVGKT